MHLWGPEVDPLAEDVLNTFVFFVLLESLPTFDS